MEKFLSYLDVFGTKMKVYIQGNTRNRTPVGGILVIITIILILSCTWVLGNDIFYKQIPNLLVQTEVLTSRPPTVLDCNTFPIAVALTDNYNNVFYDESYFEFSLQLNVINNTDGTENFNFLKLEPCTQLNFPKLTNETIAKKGISKYLCLKDQNFTLSGFWDEEIVSYASLRLKYCTGVKCKTRTEIDEFLNKNTYYWNIFFQNSLIDTQSYGSPVKGHLVSKYKVINSGEFKMWEMYIQQQRVDTDSGFIFEDFRRDSATSFEYGEFDSGDISLTEIIVFSIDL